MDSAVLVVRPTFPITSSVSTITPPSAKLSAFLAEFQELPPEKTKPHQHAGIEFLYVIKGTLEMKIGGEEFVLDAEAIYFDSASQHSYHRLQQKPCAAVIVTVP
jgi:quercetin dioxygenase-like cupin family protein